MDLVNFSPGYGLEDKIIFPRNVSNSRGSRIQLKVSKVLDQGPDYDS